MSGFYISTPVTAAVVLVLPAVLLFAAAYLLWVFYLAVMNLRRARQAGLLNKTALAFGTPVLITGYALDLIVNTLLMTLLFWERPQELTVTRRLKRHIKTGTGWRLKLALWFVPILDPFDPSGKHITD